MEWISVNDRLPDVGQIVLAVVSEPRLRFNHPYKEEVLLLYRRVIPYRRGPEIHWERPFSGETVDYDAIVTYWMPIPELPRT